MKIAGVYKITNNITGDLYIGSSNDIKHRWAVHKSPSVWKLRPGMKLYQVFIKYGLNNFTFDIIEKTTDLHNREQYYIEQLKPNYNNLYAKGRNTERRKEWKKANRDKQLAQMKAYYSRLCFYENETLTLGALSRRFFKQGIPHSTLEAKKYLIEKEH